MSEISFIEIGRKYIAKALPHAPESERQKLLNDWINKEKAAKGILEDFKMRAGDLKGKTVLDIGFGNGVTLGVFGEGGGVMSGVEVSEELFLIATAHIQKKNLKADLKLYDGENFPFHDNFFDFIYSVSVLEHTTDPFKILKESARVLKKGGKFYLAFPNRLNPKETHTGIWFLSFLPRQVAGLILGLFGRNTIPDWNLHFLSYFWLKRGLKKHNINLSVIFEDDKGVGIKKTLKSFLARLGIHHSAILPHVMVILKKI